MDRIIRRLDRKYWGRSPIIYCANLQLEEGVLIKL